MGAYNNTKAVANAILAGQTIWLSDFRAQGFGSYAENPVVAQAIRFACKENLYSQLHSSSMNGMKSGVRIIELTPWWVTALNQMELIVGGITVICATMMVLSFIIAPIVNNKNNVRRRKR